MRFFIGLFLGLCFLAGGAVTLVPAIGVALEDGFTEDVMAMFVIAGFLLLIGLLIVIGAFRTRNRTNRFDLNQTTATGMAMWMGMDHDEDDGGGGDGGD